MPFFNLNERHYTAVQKAAILEALVSLETALNPMLGTLTPEEKSTYGSVNEKNKLIINKVQDFRKSQASLSSPDVDWDEFERDYESRSFIQGILMRLSTVTGSLESSKTLHDWDNLKAALTDYNYSKYKNSTATPGYEIKVAEIKQFFAGRPKGGNQTKE